ncbi:transcriptional regulator BolA [Pigmentiphaga humi]|uniref:Transcriptional regulator BolA n=1 Tax=Pigmentiphaga humi TaxID=2478468 RepID=A0A3P4B6T1_9BURK|nr:BolA family protein [Pigmentiphaga humi]VCU71997.1 transcriptional regulator BolA [Pigmentiphaga humi]
MNQERMDWIRERLQALAPRSVEVQDDSHLHAGHAGAQGGAGHFRLLVVSSRFAGLNRVARHRLVYDRLADLMPTHIHALAIQALTPEEHSASPH